MSIRKEEKPSSSVVHAGALVMAREISIDPYFWQIRDRSKPSGKGGAEGADSAPHEQTKHHSDKGFQTGPFDPPDGLF